MRKMKDLLCYLVTAVMIFVLLPISKIARIGFAPFFVKADAAEIVDSGKCGDNATWTLDSMGVLTISGTGEVSSNSLSYRDDIHSVIIEDEITSIGSLAFYGCANLDSIVIGGSVKRIGNNAFGRTAYCEDSKNWTDGLLYADNCLLQANSDSNNSNFSIKPGTRLIADNVFYGMISLTDVSIPKSVTDIGQYVFYNCNSLKSISIPDGVTTISTHTFLGCYSLESVTIPDSVTSIGEGAFSFCKSLSDVKIPSSVTSIGAAAFKGCESLASVTIPGSVDSIGEEVFSECTNLISIEVDTNNTNYLSIDGVLFDIKKKTLYNCPAGKPDSIYVVPDGVMRIGAFAFTGYTNLTTVIIPDSVTEIGANAFNGCALSDLYYCGSEDQWKNIDIFILNDFMLDGNQLLKSVTVHFDWMGGVPEAKQDNSDIPKEQTETETPHTEAPISAVPTTTAPNTEVSPTEISSTETPSTEPVPAKNLESKAPEKASVNKEKKQVTALPGQTVDELKELLGGAPITDAEGNPIDGSKKSGTSAVVRSADGGEYTVVVPGDTDGDGAVKAADARKALRASAKIEPLSGAFEAAADLNGDGRIKAADARTILRVAVKLETVTIKPFSSDAA